MREQLDELVRGYLAITALLDSKLISSRTRVHLERFRDDLQDEIAFHHNQLQEMSANWPSYHPPR
jgi:hypothetical protein